MLVAQIIREKGGQVFTCAPGDTIGEAARALKARRVGAMVVCDEEKVVGILSERDIVGAVAGEGAAALDRPVSRFMTKDVVFARPSETLDDLMGRMSDRRIRHLPVLDDGKELCGIVSIGDLVKRKIDETVQEAETLKAYIVAG